MGADVKANVLAFLQEKSKGEKKKYYPKDIQRGLPNEDRKEIQNAVKELLDEGVLKYWSSGSTTYVMLAEYYPKDGE